MWTWGPPGRTTSMRRDRLEMCPKRKVRFDLRTVGLWRPTGHGKRTSEERPLAATPRHLAASPVTTSPQATAHRQPWTHAFTEVMANRVASGESQQASARSVSSTSSRLATVDSGTPGNTAAPPPTASSFTASLDVGCGWTRASRTRWVRPDFRPTVGTLVTQGTTTAPDDEDCPCSCPPNSVRTTSIVAMQADRFTAS